MIIHVVKRGEALWQIADRYNVTIEDIVNLNKLNNPDILLPGHALLIPTGRQTYTVQKGDTIWQIAQKYGVSPQNLLWENRILNPDLIYPGYVLTIPQKPKPEIDVNAFTYFLGSEAVPIVRDAGPYLTYLSPFAYLINEDGSLVSIADEAAIAEAYSQGVVPMMSLVNFTVNVAGENLAHLVLNNPDTIDTLQENIINTMREKGYQGLNIDFEYVLPEDREAYNNFLESTVNRLHEEGFFSFHFLGA